jgi:hypothetical protein
MVDRKVVDDQLRAIRFNPNAWNRGEVAELAAILLDDEKIFECVGGWYEGGFALLCATNMRILLVDKKPLKFLTVEDLRFDMINQIDYSHRMLDARISVSAGSKNLKFRSYNQQRLRKLIGHVQHRMAEIKTEQSSHTVKQQEHLQQIDQQLQTYLIAQYQQHESMRRQLSETGNQLNGVYNAAISQAQTIPGLAPMNYQAGIIPDQSLGVYGSTGVHGSVLSPSSNSFTAKPTTIIDATAPRTDNMDPTYIAEHGVSSRDLYNDGLREVFGKVAPTITSNNAAPTPIYQSTNQQTDSNNLLDINPLKIAYSKLPMLLKDRRYAARSILRRNGSYQSNAAVTEA